MDFVGYVSSSPSASLRTTPSSVYSVYSQKLKPKCTAIVEILLANRNTRCPIKKGPSSMLGKLPTMGIDVCINADA